MTAPAPCQGRGRHGTARAAVVETTGAWLWPQGARQPQMSGPYPRDSRCPEVRQRQLHHREAGMLNVDSAASYKLIGNPQAGAKFRMRFESAADEMNKAGNGEWIYLRFTN
jgi:hypothetical protein